MSPLRKSKTACAAAPYTFLPKYPERWERGGDDIEKIPHKLLPTNPTEGAEFGASISISNPQYFPSEGKNNRLLSIGAPGGVNKAQQKSGVVHVFEMKDLGQYDHSTTTKIVLKALLAAHDGKDGDRFGAAVASGVTESKFTNYPPSLGHVIRRERSYFCFVGAPHHSVNGLPKSGAVYAFTDAHQFPYTLTAAPLALRPRTFPENLYLSDPVTSESNLTSP